jgi:hypothetical protein
MLIVEGDRWGQPLLVVEVLVISEKTEALAIQVTTRSLTTFGMLSLKLALSRFD